MNYGYKMTGDAWADFHALEIEVQEHVLDLLEEVVDEPWKYGLQQQDVGRPRLPHLRGGRPRAGRFRPFAKR